MSAWISKIGNQYIDKERGGSMKESLDRIENYVHDMRYKNIDNILITKNGQNMYSKNFNKAFDGKKHRIASVVKSIISLGTGIAVDRGYVGLDDNICEYLGESFDDMTAKAHRKITIRDLLTLSSGIYWQFGIHASQPLWSTVEAEEDWCRAILELPSAYTPGTKFYYKDADIYLLTQVLQKATGESIENFISKNLYQPLGIVCAAVDDDFGISSNNMTNIGMLTAQEMAKIGNLCLNHGAYQGQQIISEAYLKQATAGQIDTNEFVKYFGMREYGFLWWIHEEAYFARGFGGNEIAVFPKYGLVVVIQATAKKISKEYLDVIYNVILKEESLIA